MKRYSAAFLLIAALSTASGQTVPPALMVQENGRSTPLGLSRLHTEVRILGSVAETRTTMTFTNPTARVMEGDLYFPLPEGATISGYALDILGTMVDGVAVEKHEARRVFEEVVRQGIDPGLVQWTQGNNFQTRVFPIPAKGSRTVRVECVSELVGGREAPAYHLPLKFQNKVAEFSLRVEVVRPSAPPAVAKGELANFKFEKRQDCYVAETKQQDWLPIEDLVIALPKVDGPQVVVESADDNHIYFAVHDYPAAPAIDLPKTRARHAVVFWDASGSRAGDHQREIVLLEQYLSRLLPDRFLKTEPKIDVDLVFLRNTAGEPVRVEFSKSDPSQLRTALEKVQYDGGTQLGAIGPIAGTEKPDVYLLFTDGISNFGSDEPAKLNAPLVVVSASSSSNHAYLHGLAMANGGQYFNLANWKDADILTTAGRPAWSFLSAKIEDNESPNVYPRLPQPASGRFTLVGRLPAQAISVVITYGVPGGPSEKKTFNISCADAVRGSLLRRLWAQKKLAECMIQQKKHEKEIASLGKQFNLVTPYTSLLVLDSLDQYVRYEIEPPKSLAAMRDEYLRRVDTLEHQKQKQKADKLEQVVRMWEERVKWWNVEYKYPKNFKYKDGPAGAISGLELRVSDPAARPAAPAAESAPPADFAPAAREPVPAKPGQSQQGVQQSLPAAYYLRDDVSYDGQRATHEKRKSEEGRESGGRQPGIVIKPWQPETAYLKELHAAKDKGNLFAVYMKNRAEHGTSPAFFLDCADFFRENGDSKLALQVLSNIAELQLEEAALLRVLGHRLLQIGQLDLAVRTFEQVLDLRPEEPQSYRDLALALARRAAEGGAAPEKIRADYARAIELLVEIVTRPWDGRFREIEVIALEEVNHLIPRAKAAGVEKIPLDPRLVKLLDVDVRIVMTWHADNTDIDLWVTEPSGERAYYGHNRTTIGGLVSCDFTQGYGPEEYMVRRAPPGMYRIDANYYGSRATRLLGPVTVQADVFTNYGRPNEQRKSLTLRLKEAQATVRIGEIEY